jgi:hypothetical protein
MLRAIRGRRQADTNFGCRDVDATWCGEHVGDHFLRLARALERRSDDIGELCFYVRAHDPRRVDDSL